MEKILELKNLHKSFGNLEVLKGIDLSVNKGDVISIIGSSGSGKTTLLRCLNFLEKADEGELIFDGQTYDLKKMHKKQINEIRKKTGFSVRFPSKTLHSLSVLPHTGCRQTVCAAAGNRSLQKRRLRQINAILGCVPHICR